MPHFPRFHHHPHSSSSISRAGAPRSSDSLVDSSPASDGTTGVVTTAQYPDALPSNFSERFTGPATGIVVIGADFPPDSDSQESLFELVTPDGEVLNASRVTAQSMIRSIADSIQQMRGCPTVADLSTSRQETTHPQQNGHRHHHASPPPAPRHRCTGNGSSVHGSPSANVPLSSAGPSGMDLSALPKSGTSDDVAKGRQLLKQGGFVIFSDAYVESHPESHIADITNEYHQRSPTTTAAVMNELAALDPSKQRLERMKQFIREAADFRRPLFRCRSASSVYGGASYMERPHSDAASARGDGVAGGDASPHVIYGRQMSMVKEDLIHMDEEPHEEFVSIPHYLEE